MNSLFQDIIYIDRVYATKLIKNRREVGSWLIDYASCSVFVKVQVRCWPSAMVPSQLPATSALKPGPILSTVKNSPGCSVTRTPFPIASSQSKDWI
jgi:hypothetical protein